MKRLLRRLLGLGPIDDIEAIVLRVKNLETDLKAVREWIGTLAVSVNELEQKLKKRR